MKESTNLLPCIDRTDLYTAQLRAYISHCIAELKEQEKEIRKYTEKIAHNLKDSKTDDLVRAGKKVEMAINKMRQKKMALVQKDYKPSTGRNTKTLEEIQQEENQIKKNKALLTGEMNTLFTEIIQALEKSKIFHNQSDLADKIEEKDTTSKVYTDCITQTINRLESIQTFRYIEQPDLKILGGDKQALPRESYFARHNALISCYLYTYIPGILFLLTTMLGMAHIQELCVSSYMLFCLGCIISIPNFLAVFVFIVLGVVSHCRHYYRNMQYMQIGSVIVLPLAAGIFTLAGVYWVLIWKRRVLSRSQIAKFLMIFLYISTTLSMLINGILCSKSIRKTKSQFGRVYLKLLRALYTYSCFLHTLLFSHLTLLIGFSSQNNTSTLFTIRVIGRFANLKDWLK